MRIGRQYHFSASHQLERMPEGHKCRRLHGHNYRVEVVLTGQISPADEMLMDFADLDCIVAPVIAELDHRHLNDLLADQPTVELVAFWILARLSRLLSDEVELAVKVWETENCWAAVP